MTARLVGEQERDQVHLSEEGDVIFDDTVLDKDFSGKRELVKCQYRGNAHGLVKGIGGNCVYVTPETEQFWISDYRLFHPESDGLRPYPYVSDLDGSPTDLDLGKNIKITPFPKNHRVKLFRLEVSPHRTDFVVTNDMTQHSAKDTRKGVPCEGKLSSFIVKLTNSPGSNLANAALKEFSATPLLALPWLGSA